jgi:hypothetical protein
MASIVIRDLEVNQELDRKALENLLGGWGWHSIRRKASRWTHHASRWTHHAFRWARKNIGVQYSSGKFNIYFR